MKLVDKVDIVEGRIPKYYPTPWASDGEIRQWKTAEDMKKSGYGPMLEAVVKFGRRRGGAMTRPNYPTPMRSFGDMGGKISMSNHDTVRGFREAGIPLRGELNPDWVEWLMGWPIGWTDSRPLGTGRFRSWLLSHSSALRHGLGLT
jgi:hypothetical protein